MILTLGIISSILLSEYIVNEIQIFSFQADSLIKMAN